jgi:phospholipid/cholesterol/gamma-HCH transport system substrate-binding protein
MKKNTTNTIKLGIFVTLGAALFIAGIYFIGQQRRLFSDVFSINAMFKDVSGLQIGNNVRFSGINIGSVENIEIISDTSVRVEMKIEKDVQKFIRRDAKGIIGSEGLMGNKVININPGTLGEKQIENNGMIATVDPVDMDDVMDQLKITTQNSASITGDLAVIVNNIRSGQGTIGMLFMDTTFAQNINATVVNLRQGTQGFEENMKAARNSFLLRGSLKKDKVDKGNGEKK